MFLAELPDLCTCIVQRVGWDHPALRTHPNPQLLRLRAAVLLNVALNISRMSPSTTNATLQKSNSHFRLKCGSCCFPHRERAIQAIVQARSLDLHTSLSLTLPAHAACIPSDLTPTCLLNDLHAAISTPPMCQSPHDHHRESTLL